MGSVELQIPFPRCRYSHQLQEGAQGLCSLKIKLKKKKKKKKNSVTNL